MHIHVGVIRERETYIYIYIFILLTKSTYLSEGAVNFGSLMKIC